MSNNSLVTGQNALSTSAELVIAESPNRQFAEITNADASISIYFGKDSTVDASTGHLLAAGKSFGFEGYTGPVYAIAASGTPTVTFVYW